MSLEIARRAVRISADVLEQCFQCRMSKDTVHIRFCLSAAETFYISADVLTRCLNEIEMDDKSKAEYNEIVRLPQKYEYKLGEKLSSRSYFRSVEVAQQWLMVI